MPSQISELLEELKSRFGVEPRDGIQFLTPDGLLRSPFDPGMAVLLLPRDMVAEDEGPLPGRTAHAAGAASLLRSLYPTEHPVHGLDGADDSSVGTIADAGLAAGAHFLPAVEPLANVASPHSLPWLVARLRAPDGCPWDREQDHLTLRKFLLEETYEVYDALDQGSTPELAEELGDLLLQIVLHAQYSAEDGVFDMTDVYRNVVTKIIRRHPHVFGDVVADDAAQVLRNWEQIKVGERASKSGEAGQSTPKDESVPAAFAGLSKSLPALSYAQEMQERAASLGYDWPSIEGVLDKLTEEAAELAAAVSEENRREEFGDLLMVLVNFARKSGIDAEAALRAASAKFSRRFAQVERIADERDVELRDLTFDELDEIWERAKVVAQ
jgi:tetrapyrrole methylase family protein/MazG family protein